MKDLQSRMAVEDGKSLHIVMFPWLAFGHIIPYLDLSKLIAAKGHKITFISTPRNIDRLPKLPPHLASSISFVKIPLPKLAELPDNAEATTDLLHADQMDYLKKAFDGLESGLTRFLEDAHPDWIIYDFAPYWLPPITARLGISGVFFFIINAWLLAFYGPLVSGSEPDYRSEPQDFMVPPKWIKFDTEVAYRRFEAKWIVGSVHNAGSGYSDIQRVGEIIAGTEAILLRHCREFEPQWLKVLEEVHPTRIIPLGLMPPPGDDVDGVVEDGEGWVSIRNWLGEQKKRSVVYVALGSEVTPSQEQLSELAHGLELSEVPFFWVLRKVSELPDGFEERVSGQGMVWRGWVPQLKILSDESVGGFLTHCGWSSIVEGLMFGRPLITLPFLVDQGLNSRVVVGRQLGVEIPRNEEDGSFTRQSVAESVKAVMSEEQGNKFMREKVEEVSAVVTDKELHNGYIDDFVAFLENHHVKN